MDTSLIPSTQPEEGFVGTRTTQAFGSREKALEARGEIASCWPTLASRPLALFDADRGRIFRFWSQLTEPEKEALLTQVSHLDLDLMERNLKALDTPDLLESRTAGALEPPRILDPESDPLYKEALRLGEEVLARGWLALVEGAGGTGSRFFKASGELPKGMYPISPTQRYSFFEVRLANLMALRRRYGRPIPYIVMTSDATDAQTRAYFESKAYFGLKDEIRIVRQRSLPYLEALGDGQYDLLLETPCKVAVGGYGHADFTKHVLLQPDVVAWLKGFGVKYVQWLQIDNPLAAIAHRHLLGAHRLGEASFNPSAVAMSFLSLKKVVANEAAGVLVRRGGGLAVWEYSDMDPVSQHLLEDDNGQSWLAVERHGLIQLVRPTDRREGDRLVGVPQLPQALQETLHYTWGAINPNLVVVTLESALAHPEDNPPLVAKKSAKHLDLDGNPGDMGRKFLKFEAFLFDGLNDGVVVEADREASFAPTKNAEGTVDSPTSARRLLMEFAAERLHGLGWRIHLEGGTQLELGGLLELPDTQLAERIGRNGRIDAGGALSIFSLDVRIGDGLTVTRTGQLVIEAEASAWDARASLERAPLLTLPPRFKVDTVKALVVG